MTGTYYMYVGLLLARRYDKLSHDIRAFLHLFIYPSCSGIVSKWLNILSNCRNSITACYRP